MDKNRNRKCNSYCIKFWYYCHNIGRRFKVDRLILISPIFVYNQRDITRLDKNYNFKEQVTALYNLITKAFKYTYRIDNLSEFKSDLLGLSRTTSTNNIIEHLRRISVPTLVIQGNLDFSLSASITSNILNKVNNGNISLKFIPDTGHSVNDLSRNALRGIKKFIFQD